MQTTLESAVAFHGVGLHLGRPAQMIVRPAPADHGIVFRRSDLPGQPRIAALWDKVIVAPLNTRIENGQGVSVSTIEHVMAALSGCGIHNALIDVTGPEIPILDGSAAEFVAGFLRAGVRVTDTPLKAIEILSPVRATVGEAWAELRPAHGLWISFSIDFEDAAIGAQSLALDMRNGAFGRHLCDARTFCRAADVDRMHEQGLALGGTYENAVVVDGDRVLSPGGLRRADEAVRHKMLDAMGDLYTAGRPILGAYHGHKAGHAVTNALLRELHARPDAWRIVTCDEHVCADLPGVGLHLLDLPDVA